MFGIKAEICKQGDDRPNGWTLPNLMHMQGTCGGFRF